MVPRRWCPGKREKLSRGTETGLTADELLAQFPPPIIETANELRSFVRQHLPEARETAYRGWQAIGYRHPEAGYVGGIFLFEDYVKFIFEHGHLLPDPDGLLEGRTKQTRHLTIAPGNPAPGDAFARLLAAAVDVGNARKTR